MRPGYRKLVGLGLTLAAIVAAGALAPDNQSLALAIGAAYGAYVAGNREEHRIKSEATNAE